MPKTMLCCDQALFTSVRTPMGEGYRIIAASKGLKPGEKQEITRNSPSHEALCLEGDVTVASPLAVAFYPLATGRRCLAMSRLAGAEQTGRGGQRVHTHIVVFDATDLSRFGFNPLRILRALVESAGTEPKLDPPAVLPELELSVDDSDCPVAPPLPSATRMHILRSLLDGRDLVMAMPGDWLTAAEAILLGLPGPVRADVSFGAGLQFSLSRLHRLNLLSDEKGKAKLRTTGQTVDYMNTDSTEPLPVLASSSWLTFVERCYASGDMACLSRRTSRAYTDTTPVGCERLGDLFGTIDRIPQCDCQTMLRMASESFSDTSEGPAGELREELVEALKRHLPDRFDATPITDACRLWEPIVALWRRPGREAAFAQNLLVRAVSRITNEDPLLAARLTAGIAVEAAQHEDADGCNALFVQVLTRLRQWIATAADARTVEAVPVAQLWQQVRPYSKTVRELCLACGMAPADNPSA